jgi:hypothetical protein
MNTTVLQKQMSDKVKFTYDHDTIEVEIRPVGSKNFTIFSVTFLILLTLTFAYSLYITPPGYYLFPILLWFSAAFFIVYLIVCNYFAKIIVRITPETLTIKDDICGYGVTKYFNISEIKNFRVANFLDKVSTRNASGLLQFRLYDGKIAFEYRKKTYRFGQQISTNEAITIAEKLKTYIKQIKYDTQPV